MNEPLKFMGEKPLYSGKFLDKLPLNPHNCLGASSHSTPQETSEQSQVEIAFNDWYRNWTRNICVHDEKNKLLYKAAFFHSWLIQQKRIDELTEALKKIANMDYRGNRSTESQIAYAALSSSKEEKDKKDDGNL